MGLDMYLTKKTYVKNWDHMDADRRHQITVKLDGKVRKDIKPKRICNIEEEVMYWRKCNAIHKWFVDNVQDGKDECQESYVDRRDIEALAEICEDVVKTKDPSLLPPSSGFFFGSTEDDEWYYKDLKETAKVFRELLKEEGGSFYYQASW
jgi:hypothetical protein